MSIAISRPMTKRGGPNLIWVLLAVMIALIVAAPALAQAAPAAPVPGVADAQIAYTGKGDVARASRQGWLSRFFAVVSPF